MKLYAHHKESIINRILADTFKAREEAVEAGFTELAERIYSELYGHLRALLSTVPREWLSLSSGIKVEFPDSHSQTRDYLKLKESRPVPTNCEQFNRVVAVYRKPEPHAEEHLRLTQLRDKIKDDKRELRNTLTTLFAGVSTRKKALEVWPECEPYLPTEPESKKNLPALPTHNLNDMIKRMKGT